MVAEWDNNIDLSTLQYFNICSFIPRAWALGILNIHRHQTANRQFELVLIDFEFCFPFRHIHSGLECACAEAYVFVSAKDSVFCFNHSRTSLCAACFSCKISVNASKAVLQH